MTHGTLTVKLKPRARRNEIRVEHDGTVTIAVTSPPIENKANDHCITLLSKRLGCRKQALSILKGGHSRNKVLACKDLSSEAMLHVLSDLQ